jgi:hypothetical protein
MLVGLLVAGVALADPFGPANVVTPTGEFGVLDYTPPVGSEIDGDLTAVGDVMLGFISSNWSLILTLLGLAFGLPWAIRLFKRLAS